MNKKVLLLGSLLVVPLLIFLALGFGHDPNEIESPLLGKAAPSFSLVDLDGERVRLDELRGQPVVLNFWASWCRPCATEHPVLRAAARRYAGRVRFLGVIYHDPPERIRTFVERRGEWGPTLVDEGSKVAIAYGVFGAPETFFINAEGVITQKVSGALGPRQLAEILDGLLS